MDGSVNQDCRVGWFAMNFSGLFGSRHNGCAPVAHSGQNENPNGTKKCPFHLFPLSLYPPIPSF